MKNNEGSSIEKWKNRIVETGEKAASEFNFHPQNWRKHPARQREALNSVLSEIGWVAGVIENATTGNLIDGHARVGEALRRSPNEPVPYIRVQLTEVEEKTILAVFDPIGEMAEIDAEIYRELYANTETANSDLLDLISATLAADAESNAGSETVEIVKASHEAGNSLIWLKFGKLQTPLTEEEYEELEKRFFAFVEETGTGYGFVAALLGLV